MAWVLIKGQMFGRVPAHAHKNLLDEWELCTDNDCKVYRLQREVASAESTHRRVE